MKASDYLALVLIGACLFGGYLHVKSAADDRIFAVFPGEIENLEILVIQREEHAGITFDVYIKNVGKEAASFKSDKGHSYILGIGGNESASVMTGKTAWPDIDGAEIAGGGIFHSSAAISDERLPFDGIVHVKLSRIKNIGGGTGPVINEFVFKL